jgi:hypothetical protein
MAITMMKGKNVVISDARLEKDGESTSSRKVVMEKLLDGEETITITVKRSMTGHHERKAEGLTSAREDRKWKLTTTNQEQAVRPPTGPVRPSSCRIGLLG